MIFNYFVQVFHIHKSVWRSTHCILIRTATISHKTRFQGQEIKLHCNKITVSNVHSIPGDWRYHSVNPNHTWHFLLTRSGQPFCFTSVFQSWWMEFSWRAWTLHTGIGNGWSQAMLLLHSLQPTPAKCQSRVTMLWLSMIPRRRGRDGSGTEL